MGIEINQKPEETTQIERKYALIVGVDSHEDKKIPCLHGVGKDLEKFEALLEDRERSDFEVSKLHNPTFIEVRKAISAICQKAQNNNLVFFYFSGFGILDDHKSLYLVLFDSESEYKEATCLESEFILSQFKKSKCRNFIIIIDCCHSGAFFNNNRGLPQGLYALTACAEEGAAFETSEGGLFTSIILDGLTSDYIDANRDGKITFSELFDYVIDEQKKRTNQSPQKWEWNVNKDISFFDSPRPVFISYQRSRKAFVKKLSKRFRDEGIPTYVDLEKIRIGDKWQEELEKTIKNARVFIFVLDPEILYSKVSNWELETAFKHDVPILPIMLEDIRMPAMFEEKYGAINRVFFDEEGFEESFEILAKHIKALRQRK